MRKTSLIFLIWLALAYGSAVAQITFLQAYIDKAWNKNEALKSREFDLKSAEWSYKEAKAMYGPTLAFNANYTLAAGGRNISFPVGDLLNPVYNTLNSLTGTQQFNLLQNQEINFFPNNFYDAKLVASQAIYYPDLAINQKLKGYDKEIKVLEVRAFKRQISKEVMVASFQVANAQALGMIYWDAGILVNEAKRATQSMVNNDVAPIIALRRIEAQLASLEAQQKEATGLYKNAQAYFQFLSGDTLVYNTLHDLPELPPMDVSAGQSREEIQQLQTLESMTALSLDKENSYYKPRLGTQLSLGPQDGNFGWQPDALLGINLDINLFDSKRHHYRKDAAKAKMEAQQAQYQHTTDMIALQALTTENNLRTAIDQAQLFFPRIGAANQLYKDSYNRYKEGNANYLELLDAQTQLTQTQIQYQIARYNAWIKWSEWVYALAILPIP